MGYNYPTAVRVTGPQAFGRAIYVSGSPANDNRRALQIVDDLMRYRVPPRPANQNNVPMRNPLEEIHGWGTKAGMVLKVLNQARLAMAVARWAQRDIILSGYLLDPSTTGWGLVASCLRGPGEVMAVGGLYCGPIGQPAPGGIQEDPTSWSFQTFTFDPIAYPDTEWRFNELWGKAKALIPGETPPAIPWEVGYWKAKDPWPWARSWASAARWLKPQRAPNRMLNSVVEIVPPTVPQPLPVPLHPPAFPRPPGKGRKEVKLRSAGILGAVGWGLLNGATEIADFVGALEDGLPKVDRAGAVWVPGGPLNWYRDLAGRWSQRPGAYRAPTLQEKVASIYAHFNAMDWNKAFWALVKNEIEDQVIGRIGRKAADASRTSGRPLGYQSGPAL